MTETQLFEAIKNGAMILSANRRLAGFFKQKYAEFQSQQQQQVWMSPSIHSFQDYLLTCWQETDFQQLSFNKQLLTLFQSQLLWQNIIKNTAIHEVLLDDLLNIEATTNTAISAWELIHAWNLSLDTLPVATRIDEYAFQLWAQHYQDYLTKHHYIDNAILCREITQLFQNNKRRLPKHIIFSGFDSLTPQQKSLIATLEQQGCNVSFFEFALKPDKVAQLACDNESQEFELAALFCQQQLLQGCRSIAVVVPELQQKRSAIERVFNALSENFNISAGKTLSEYPVVDVALALLSWTERAIALNTVSYLIRSPFIMGSETEWYKRQTLDRALKECAQIEVPFKTLVTLSQKQHCEQFSILLQQLPLKHSQAKSCHDWSNLFLQKLKHCGWPGERTVSSEEFQTIERFQTLLSTEFTQLATIFEKISFSTALHYLTKLCQQTIFQPKKIEQATIQILGLLEASGLIFDKMWITGLTEKQIPTPPQLNPLLSIDMQRHLQMPHATIEREYEFSKKLLERLTHSAKEVILSFPAAIDDERCKPSPLLETFNKMSKDDLIPTLAATEKQPRLNQEQIPDSAVLFNIDKEVLHGGSSILKEQSLCSFRAFASHRLHCKSLPTAEFALSTRERGTIIHNILEILWKKLQSKEHLKNNFSEEKDALFFLFICKEIEDVLHQYHLNEQVFELEKEHLSDLLMHYFKQELTRDDFVILDLEKQIEVTLKNFKLNLRIDRVDQLPDGSIAIIDYKTGECKTAEWFGARPTAPQLPLYAACYQPTPNQVLFAQLKRGKCEFIGVSAQDTDIKTIKTLDKIESAAISWQQQILEWKITCEQLIDDFQQGDIKLNPHPTKQPCKTCDVKMLCRIFETKDYEAITD